MEHKDEMESEKEIQDSFADEYVNVMEDSNLLKLLQARSMTSIKDVVYESKENPVDEPYP